MMTVTSSAYVDPLKVGKICYAVQAWELPGFFFVVVLLAIMVLNIIHITSGKEETLGA